MHKRVEMDTTSIMRYVLASTAQQDINVSIAGLRDSLTLAVQKIRELAEAVNDHADHFATHHDGLSWAVRQITTAERDSKAELNLIKGRVSDFNSKYAEITSMKEVIEQNDQVIKQKVDELATSANAAIQGFRQHDASLAQAATGLGLRSGVPEEGRGAGARVSGQQIGQEHARRRGPDPLA